MSSVIEGYEELRSAAADGIEDGGGEPVMVERFPSLAVSPRNACLDGVGTSDAYLVLVGQRAGWTTPSGGLATEEEFDEARRLSRPMVAFVEAVDQREPRAVEFAKKVSDYVSGGFRTTFRDAAGLRTAVARAVRNLRSAMDLPLSDPERVSTLLLAGRDQSYEASIRLALVPERFGEIVSPARLESDDLVQELYALGHGRGVRFFDYSAPKEPNLSAEGVLTISQRSGRGRDRNAAGLSLSESGELTLGKDIGERDPGDSIRDFHSIVEADLAAALECAFGFAAGVFDLVDRHERYSTLWAGVALLDVGSRYLYREPPTGGSVPVRMGDSGPVVAEKKPRRIARAQMRSPKTEIERLVTLFRRLLGPPSGRQPTQAVDI